MLKITSIEITDKNGSYSHMQPSYECKLIIKNSLSDKNEHNEIAVKELQFDRITLNEIAGRLLAEFKAIIDNG